MIKEINSDEIKEITELFIDSFNNPPWNDEWTYKTASKRIIDIINTPGYYGMAYYEDNVLLGMIMGRAEQYFNGESFQILEFCIRRDMQRQGLGRKLLTEFKNKLKEKNIVSVFLITLHGHSTEGFYKNNGFKCDDNMLIMSTSLKK